jgi:hypothetical protein
MENKEMGKELENFEFKIKTEDTKGISYKQDSEMEAQIRMDFLKENYGEERILEILSQNDILISDLSNQNIFIEVRQIAES